MRLNADITFLHTLTEHMLFRILLIIALTLTGTWLIWKGSWLCGGVTILLLIVCIRWAIVLYQSRVKKLILLLDALENNDNSLRFFEQSAHPDNRMINHLLNRISHILHEAKAEVIQQEKYYERILNCIDGGVMTLNEHGAVYQKNNELLRLFGLEIFTHIRQLNNVDPVLMEKLSSACSGDKFHVHFSNERETINLSVRVSDIMIRKEHLRIFALNDISNELDEKEIDSWMRLIRVLTHEIMNSLTPITSLSDTLLILTDPADKEITQGLQTISTTGKALLTFVESYRKFTRIPTPEPTLFYVKAFMGRMVELARHQLSCQNITFTIKTDPEDLIVYADENLISQVVSNILKNAIQAIDNQPNGKIEIYSCCSETEDVCIEISNNGPQIPPEVAEQIFIPFFTTKQGGNGIGLSLSKQIMKLSGGTLSMNSTQQLNKTTFTLQFK